MPSEQKKKRRIICAVASFVGTYNAPLRFERHIQCVTACQLRVLLAVSSWVSLLPLLNLLLAQLLLLKLLNSELLTLSLVHRQSKILARISIVGVAHWWFITAEILLSVLVVVGVAMLLVSEAPAVIIATSAVIVIISARSMMMLVTVVSEAVAHQSTAGEHADHAHDVFYRTEVHRTLMSVLLVAELLTAKLIFVSGMFSAVRLVTLLMRLLVPFVIVRYAFAGWLTLAWWLVLRVEYFAVTELCKFFHAVDFEDLSALDFVGVGFQSFDRVFILFDKSFDHVELEFI